MTLRELGAVRPEDDGRVNEDGELVAEGFEQQLVAGAEDIHSSPRMTWLIRIAWSSTASARW